MKPDEFEQQLRSQPLRPVPPVWREEILRAAQSAALRQPSAPLIQSVPWWREWLWPCPQAWAGLAAVWMILLGLRLASPTASAPMIARHSPPSPETQTALAAQRRELTYLLDGPAEGAPAAMRAVPGPRSDLMSPSKA